MKKPPLQQHEQRVRVVVARDRDRHRRECQDQAGDEPRGQGERSKYRRHQRRSPSDDQQNACANLEQQNQNEEGLGCSQSQLPKVGHRPIPPQELLGGGPQEERGHQRSSDEQNGPIQTAVPDQLDIRLRCDGLRHVVSEDRVIR